METSQFLVKSNFYLSFILCLCIVGVLLSCYTLVHDLARGWLLFLFVIILLDATELAAYVTGIAYFFTTFLAMGFWFWLATCGAYNVLIFWIWLCWLAFFLAFEIFWGVFLAEVDWLEDELELLVLKFFSILLITDYAVIFLVKAKLNIFWVSSRWLLILALISSRKQTLAKNYISGSFISCCRWAKFIVNYSILLRYLPFFYSNLLWVWWNNYLILLLATYCSF